MMIHAIISVADAESFEKRIVEAFPDKWLKAQEGQWFVAADLTSQQVTEKLGVYKDKARCIILAITSYNGLHDSNTWEWIGFSRCRKI